MVGGFNPSEKYESPLGFLFPTEWKKNVPNHQPAKSQAFPSKWPIPCCKLGSLCPTSEIQKGVALPPDHGKDQKNHMWQSQSHWLSMKMYEMSNMSLSENRV